MNIHKANTEFNLLVYEHFGCSGPVTENQREEYLQLGHYDPRKGKQMNEIIDHMVEITDGDKHYILALDQDGNEVKIEVQPNGEFSQDVEDKEEVPTVH